MIKNVLENVLSGFTTSIRRRKMYKYEVIVWWSEKDQVYIAEVPELPGCMSDGKTYEETLKHSSNYF